MKAYAVRKEGRFSVECQFYCFTEDQLINGKVRDLSPTGWRVTLDRPLPVGVEQTVFITLRDESGYYHALIESAMVRWADGFETGWEITRIDELDSTRLIEFLEHRERKHAVPDILHKYNCLPDESGNRGPALQPSDYSVLH
ncbi:MAG: PilZ domain-containing protein [Nitrospira sp.]|nr:PilZ domain-containing protein [Nitrospira sp.]